MIKFDLSQGDRGDFYITSKKIFTKDEAKKVIKELNMLQKLGISLFSENRTHVYIKVSDYKRLKLFASGKGLCKIKGGIYNNEPEEIVKVVENTEDGILQNLLGRIPKPEER